MARMVDSEELKEVIDQPLGSSRRVDLPAFVAELIR
jgi:hypothetical protein